MPRRTRTPSYRLHRPTGLAVVTLNGRDHYLGRHGTRESKAEYDRLIAEWLLRGRRLPPPPKQGPTTAPQVDPGPGQPSSPTSPAPGAPDELTVNEMLLAYWRHAQTYYRGKDGRPSREIDNIRDALRPVRTLYGTSAVLRFGPLALRAVRDEMVRSGLATTTVNNRVHKIRRCFRWAAAVELIPGSIVQGLEAVEPLKRGRSPARDPEPVGPVPVEHVEAVLPFLSPPVAAMVRIQLLTGCRPSEVMAMRGCDLAPAPQGPNWEYRPASHKNAWRAQPRVIPLGRQARAIIEQFLKPDPNSYLFSPRDAVKAHHLKRSMGRRSRPTPSELARRCHGDPGRDRSDRYDRRTYRQAVIRACRRAGVSAWNPLELRHTRAMIVREKYGLEGAQAHLGHARPDTTLIYLERDLSRAHQIAAEIG
jgi:integrase